MSASEDAFLQLLSLASMSNFVNNTYFGNNSSSCDLCADEWVFIIATGRSGSTTLLNMLNLIPGYSLSGENNGIMRAARDFFRRMSVTIARARLSENRHLHGAWQEETPLSAKQVLCNLQSLVRTTLYPRETSETHIRGFKEIRHDEADVEFMHKLFPCARFVVNTRDDVDEQFASQSMEFDSQKITEVEDLAKVSSGLKAWASEHAPISYQMPLENFSVDGFNDMLTWLGVTGCRYTAVGIHTFHSKNVTDEPGELTGLCQLSHKMPRGNTHDAF
eukprot:119878-Amphidinium_carterae.1